MNTVQIKKQNISVMAEEKEKAYLLNGFSGVGRDRSPFAVASIIGNGRNQNVVGEASFYHTPLGVLISVWMKGFEARRQTYNIRIVEASDERPSGYILPPLYERGGYAFFSSLTGKVTTGEVLGRRISVSKRSSDGEEEIAFGYIDSVLLKKKARIV